MEIQCECGQFRAELMKFPSDTPGRLVCYCDDCQTYLHYLKRTDLLDDAGGTEVIPAYPIDVKFISGKENLKCLRLSPQGIYRWYSGCCNTPIGNTNPKLPWVGFLHRVYNVKDPKFLEKTLGAVRSRIRGRFAKGTPPQGTAQEIELKDAMAVLPFMLKGMLLGKRKNSPFFEKDGVTPVVSPQVLSKEERTALLKKLKAE